MTAFSLDYNPIASWLSSLGYFVCVLILVGSTGFGIAHMDRVFGTASGVADLDDCAAAAEYMRGLDGVDARRGVGTGTGSTALRAMTAPRARHARAPSRGHRRLVLPAAPPRSATTDHAADGRMGVRGRGARRASSTRRSRRRPTRRAARAARRGRHRRAVRAGARARRGGRPTNLTLTLTPSPHLQSLHHPGALFVEGGARAPQQIRPRRRSSSPASGGRARHGRVDAGDAGDGSRMRDFLRPPEAVDFTDNLHGDLTAY